MIRALFVVLILAVPSLAVAAADDLKTYAANITAAPAKADAVTKNCAILILPNGELRKSAPTVRVKDLLGEDIAGVSLVATKVTSGEIHSTSMANWYDVEVEARVGKKVVARLRLVASGGRQPPQFEQFEIQFAHWMKPIADRDARRLKPVTVPAIKDETAPARTTDSDYRQLIDGVSAGGKDVGATLVDGVKSWDMVVFGSSPRERYKGKQGAAAIKGWKIKIDATGGAYRADNGEFCAASQFTGTTTTKPAATIPYVGLVCYHYQMSGGGSPVVVPAYATFAIPQ